MLSGANKLVLAGAFLLASMLASVQGQAVCNDMVLPSLGNDATVSLLFSCLVPRSQQHIAKLFIHLFRSPSIQPGFIPAGPELVATTDGAPAYSFVISPTSDTLDFYVQSQPGVGDNTTFFSRRVAIALASRSTLNYASALTGLAPQCRKVFERFEFTDIAPGVTISNSATDLSNSAASTASACFFNHKYSVDWNLFRSDYANCGFTITDSAQERTFTGRVHVLWEDYVSLAATLPVRQNATTWYDVTITMDTAFNTTTASSNNTEQAYNADFQVSSVTYSKNSDGLVTAFIDFSMTTKYPYYPSFDANTDAATWLIHNDQNLYAGRPLLSAASYPDGAFDKDLVRNGMVDSSGNDCNALGKTCQLSGTLMYKWTPTSSKSASCSISTSQAYQFDIYLECFARAGVNNSGCGLEARKALNLPNFAAFKLDGNIDFCKAPSSDFPITWSPEFQVGKETRTIGEAITATGTFTTNKRLTAVAIQQLNVYRADLGGYWALWAGAADAVSGGDSGNAGASTQIGKNVALTATVQGTNGNKQWQIDVSFTPNIQLLDTLVDRLTAGAGDRADYMITLPNDKDQLLAYRIHLFIRMYADPTQTFTNLRRRRLVFRDTPIPTIATLATVKDIDVVTEDVNVKVPANVQVSTDGSITVVQGQNGLSVGAIAGIAAVGAIVGAAAVALTIVLVKRRQQQKKISASDGLPQTSADFLTARSTALPLDDVKIQPIESQPGVPDWGNYSKKVVA